MKSGPKPLPADQRFWRRVEKIDGGCWLWCGQRFPNRYAQMLTDERFNTTAHRFSYLLHGGEIPAGMFICHRCDVRNCVNPAHLYVGTHEDNNRDRVERA